jgi:hypothetical protein
VAFFAHRDERCCISHEEAFDFHNLHGCAALREEYQP